MTLVEKAYNAIKAQIVAGDLTAGMVLSENTFAQKLGISRTPVGEAFRKLSEEGLLEQIPRYGTVVREVSIDELSELYELREALESYAAGKAAERITPPYIKKLQWLVDTMHRIANETREKGKAELDAEALKQFLGADMAYHLMILEVGGNARLLDIISSTQTISGIFHARRQKHSLSILDSTHTYHSKILEALRTGNATIARETMLEHIERSYQQTLAACQNEQKLGPIHSPALDALPESLRKELAALETKNPV
jgi:DNA-binding GntR family transcriptional regulator